MSALYIVATPIGNLEDISLRALRVLKEVDVILCEDTRVTKKLLLHFGIEKPLISYHQRSDKGKVDDILRLLERGKNLALVSDSGTPGISDPGNELISRVFEAKLQTIHVVPIPGPSALTAAASIAGFPMDRFTFLGFAPAKKGRKKFFEQVVSSPYPVIFYESPYRIVRTLQELQSVVIGHKSSVNVVVGRELTKKFETVYRGTLTEIVQKIHADSARGEFVIIVWGVDRA